MTNKIYDGKGNTFAPSKDQARLYNAGWRVVERRKQGAFWIVRWSDPQINEDQMHNVWSQGIALQILKDRKKEQ